MKNNSVHINKFLLPFSWLYRFVVFIRNKFFSLGILKRKEYAVPVICIGNITVGGTGKTPHTEYLVRLLKDRYKVAVLSRGYKRKTNGFVLATNTSTSADIGDESFQIKSKYPNILVAVDGNRRRGIEKLLALDKGIRPEVILLDDAFQHRYVKPSFTILLVDYNRPICHDTLLPAGRLREPAHYAEFANVILITKCPKDIKPIDIRIISHDINPYPYQQLLYTTLDYGVLKPVFDNQKKDLSLDYLTNKKVLLVVGIASPKVLIEEIKKYTSHIQVLSFSDHHVFTKKDIKQIIATFESLKGNPILVTTEKDAARLLLVKKIPEELKKAMYYLPIEVSFVREEEQELFNEKIINHVERNTRNSSLH